MLEEVIVLDLSRALAGPYAGMVLADLGARVIKVEAPHGDDSRGWGPPFVGEGSDRESTYYLSCNRNKESVVADLHTPDGRELLSRLIKQADALIENFRPGVMDRLGFSAEQMRALNPRLIICSISGFGHDGPEAQRPGYDQIAQGEAGFMSLTGPSPTEPTKVGVPIADLLAGMNTVIGVLAALSDRARTGHGRVVRTSLLAGLVAIHAYQGTRWTIAGEVPQAMGNHHPSIAPYGTFNTSDGIIQIAVGSEKLWHSFSTAIGLATDDPSLATNALRVENRSRLTNDINMILRECPTAHWQGVFDEAGIPCGRVRALDEVYQWEQTTSQGLVVDVAHPRLGTIQLPGSPLRFDDNRHSGGIAVHRAPPELGEHTEAVLTRLAGLTTDEIAALRERNIV